MRKTSSLLTRPLALATSALLLAFALTACGDDEAKDNDKPDADASSSLATDASTSVDTDTDGPDDDPDDTDGPDDDATDDSDGHDGHDGDDSTTGPAADTEFCKAFSKVYTSMTGLATGKPNAAQWKQLQTDFAAWSSADIPAGASPRVKEGFSIMFRAIAGLDYDEAQRAFQSGGDEFPGLTKAENEKAEDAADFTTDVCGEPQP